MNTAPTKKQIEECAESLLRHEVHACQTALVDSLMKLSGEPGDAFSQEEIENLYPDPSEWTVQQCREWCAKYESGGLESDLDRCDKGAEQTGEDNVQAYRYVVNDNAEPIEVFEWWSISGYLGREMNELGIPLLCNDYGTWWGRTCTGQGVLQDGTLQAVAKQILSYHPPS